MESHSLSCILRPQMNATLHKVKATQCITAPKIIAGSCSDALTVKMAEKPQKNGKESCWKYWLNIDNWRLEIFAENGRSPAKTEGLESLLVSQKHSFLCDLCISQFQLRPAPSRAAAGHSVARLVSPGGWAFANFALSRGRAFANPGANPALLTRTQFLVRIQLHKGSYWKNKRIGSFVKDGKQLKRIVKACSRFYACISSLLSSQNYIAKSRAIDVNQRLLNQISVEYYLKNILSYL